jgi:hypothetical protein
MPRDRLPALEADHIRHDIIPDSRRGALTLIGRIAVASREFDPRLYTSALGSSSDALRDSMNKAAKQGGLTITQAARPEIQDLAFG